MKRIRNITCLFALAVCLPWVQGWAQEQDEPVVLRMEMKSLILEGKDVTDIDVRGSLMELHAENNSMSLSTVYALLAARPKDAAYHFNPQRIEKCLKAGEVWDLRSEFTIADCPSEYALYDESTGGVVAAQNYTLVNGMLTMRHSGSYRLVLSNRAVTDYTENGGVGVPDTCVYSLQVGVGVLHTVSVRSEDLSKGTVSGGGTYEDGDYATITATANEGYVFDRWDSNGVYFSGERNLVFSVYSDYDLTAYFISTGGVGNEEGVSDRGGLRVYAKDKVIYLSEEVEEVRVFTLAGQLVYAGRSTAVPVAAPGVYVVRVGAVCHKVMVF